jgi:uncharacterized membrane protein YccC
MRAVSQGRNKALGGDVPDSSTEIPADNTSTWLGIPRSELIHAGRTAVAAVASLLVARLFRLPESYWAAITTVIVMQSTVGAAVTISKHRFVGTALGAATGAVLSTYVGSSWVVFGLGLFALGLICAALGMERNAYRYAGITLIIVMLVARTRSAWIVAMHRFFEISVGILVGLALTAAWPERGRGRS